MSDLNIQAIVTDHVTVDAGVATVAQEGIDAALLAVDVDPKEYKRMQKAAASAAVGIVDVIGEKAVDAMAADKNLANVTGNFKLGHEEYQVGVAREATIRIPGKTGDEAQKQVFGSTTVRRKTKIGNNGIGDAKRRIAALGIKRLGV